MHRTCAERNVSLLTELRFVAREVGLVEARRMPTEVRRWWIAEMIKERDAKREEVLGAFANPDGSGARAHARRGDR